MKRLFIALKTVVFGKPAPHRKYFAHYSPQRESWIVKCYEDSDLCLLEAKMQELAEYYTNKGIAYKIV